MNLRQIMLLAISATVCLLALQSIYIYKHPAIVASVSYLSFSIALYVILGVGLVYAMYYVRKNVLRRVKREQSVLYLASRYRTMIEDSGITILNTDANGFITFVSENAERLSGFTPSAMVGLHITQCMPHEFRDYINKIIARTVNGEVMEQTLEVQIYTKAHVKKWIGCQLYFMMNEDGGFKDLQFIIWDNEKNKTLALELEKAEERRRHQQQLLQSVIDNNPNIIYVKDLEGKYLLMNRKLKEMVDISPDMDVSTISEEDVFKYNRNSLENYRRLHRLIIENKQTMAFEETFSYKGTEKYFYIMKFPVLDENGNTIYVCGVSVDITELKKAQLEMIDAREEALQAKEAQENFLANMSHEIRTPMNGVMGMGNLLLDTSLNDVQKEYVQSIKESAENLLSIINDLLDFSKIKSGKFHIDVNDFNIADTVRKAIYPLQVKAQEKDLALNCLIDTGVPEVVTGDALRLQQMIINLAANAVKFTSEGAITVKLYPIEHNDNDVLLGIDVADTGIGLPADKLDKVFELYTQVDKNTSRIYGGTGLGLAIVKQLAELQNGTVSVKSEYGKGSVFTLQIPYKIKQQAVKKVEISSAAQQTGLLQGVKVLVAEDNLINQKVVLYTLKNQGADVIMTCNGKEAVETLTTDKCDIVLMDLQMPEMDGYQATTYIRNQLKLDIPIIAMTADAMKGESDKCIDAGMQDYISKPFEPKELFEKILSFANTNAMT
ncbi:MAG TPA: ATP-binding protein [Flavipsychrobacter sp.]